MKIGKIFNNTADFIYNNMSVILGSILAGGLIASLDHIERDVEEIKKNTKY